jgi:putative addiction module component (TIGR02574 family)
MQHGGITQSGDIAMPTYETLLTDASRLSVEDRIRLLDGIWDTLPADALPPLSEEWVAEIQRRSAEYDAGKAQTVSWEQIKAEALRRVGMAVPDAGH